MSMTQDQIERAIGKIEAWLHQYDDVIPPTACRPTAVLMADDIRLGRWDDILVDLEVVQADQQAYDSAQRSRASMRDLADSLRKELAR